MNKPVTVILTSCGRFDLLRRTIESFLLWNTYPIKEFIINDDSGELAPEWLDIEFPFITFYRKPNKLNRNQIASLDFLWSLVKTPYAFTLEDDWEFCKGEFIEKSMAIMERHDKIIQVWLQPLEPNNQHPINWLPPVGRYDSYGIMALLHAAIRFNPSLKRKSDYDFIAPFAKHTIWNPAKPWKCEADIAKVYTELGYRAAILPGRYVTHIGEGRHVGV